MFFPQFLHMLFIGTYHITFQILFASKQKKLNEWNAIDFNMIDVVKECKYIY